MIENETSKKGIAINPKTSNARFIPSRWIIFKIWTSINKAKTKNIIIKITAGPPGPKKPEIPNNIIGLPTKKNIPTWIPKLAKSHLNPVLVSALVTTNPIFNKINPTMKAIIMTTIIPGTQVGPFCPFCPFWSNVNIIVNLILL